MVILCEAGMTKFFFLDVFEQTRNLRQDGPNLLSVKACIVGDKRVAWPSVYCKEIYLRLLGRIDQ